ncbi:carotenoid oxygenase family protein [Haladaptatus halobius]|uniref:carotenoid oxygenase family protein n=1 Tax=Haladaptatus halobius TaxID=2884875 RepID=UPI001D0A632D|nr:carotenoid oxygenase family protein [Haladaptatus halobius]
MPAYSPGFRSLDVERDGLELAVEGEIPAWLSGSLVRNGPAMFEVGGRRVEHWFDGLAMLHKFRFADGDVVYSNRFLRTDTFEKAVEEGTLSNQFATSGGYLDRLRSFVGKPTDNANVNVAKLDGEYVALTETSRRVRFDPETLSARGDLVYEDDLTGHHVTAHLQHDREAGKTVGYMTEFGRRNRYHVYGVPDDRPERVPLASVEVERPAYLHSFALTPRYVVLVEPPYVVNPFRFFLPGGGFIDHFRWRPERGTRFLVFDRSSGERVAEPTTNPFFFFHTVNAFESGDEIVVDLVAYDDATIVEDLFMASVEGGSAGASRDAEPFPGASEGVLTRLRVPTDGGEIGRRASYRGIELPRVAPSARTRPYRYAYGQATGRRGENGLVKVDVETGTSREWWEEAKYAGEPIFVADPAAEEGASDEDRGVVLAPVLDVETERSLLLVLDSETFAERARAHVPHHIPFGFHGEFFPEITS